MFAMIFQFDFHLLVYFLQFPDLNFNFLNEFLVWGNFVSLLLFVSDFFFWISFPIASLSSMLNLIFSIFFFILCPLFRNIQMFEVYDFEELKIETAYINCDRDYSFLLHIECFPAKQRYTHAVSERLENRIKNLSISINYSKIFLSTDFRLSHHS